MAAEAGAAVGRAARLLSQNLSSTAGVRQAVAEAAGKPLSLVSSFGWLPSLFGTASPLATKEREPLYSTHVRLSAAEKASVAVLSAVTALARPQRADLVAALGETTGTAALHLMRQQMQMTEEGRRILTERPRVTNHLWETAAGCPPRSFGRAYADFMEDRRFEADERPPVRFVDNPELAYVVARSREVHDFWHVLFDCHTNVLGELALKGVEAVQTGLPMAALSVMGGHLRLSPDARAALLGTYLPWALKTASRCSPLISIHYELYFEEDLEALRRRWRITPAPKTRLMRGVQMPKRQQL